MQPDPKLDRILVVITPDLMTPGAPEKSSLLKRAIKLANSTGSELELFHVCYEETLEQKIFGSDADVADEKEKILSQSAAALAEIILSLEDAGVTIRHDVRWDYPRTDAILRKIDESKPDLVMKQSREHGYVIGLIGNTDWDLIRRSPTHVWFVKDDDTSDIHRIVTAVGTVSRDEDIISAADYEVFQLARTIAEDLSADIVPVHAYQPPQGLKGYAMYAASLGGMMATPANQLRTLDAARQAVITEHSRQIRAFAEYFHIDPDRVELCEGPPITVLPEVVKSLDADLLVMGAQNLSRWERLLGPIHAEPVLARARCDVLFAKESAGAAIPVAAEQPATGSPPIDLERAMTEPENTFSSPEAVADMSAISVSMRKRILQAWEHDIRAQLVEEDEGGPVKTSKADVLDELQTALNHISARQESDRRRTNPVERLREHAD